MEPDSTAFITLSVIGKLLARPNVLTRGQADIPPVHRLTVFFEGADGAAWIIGCELRSEKDIHPLESDDVELLLEARIPLAEGQEPVAIGYLLDGAALTLLDLRDPGWAAGAGSRGKAEIRWRSLPGGEILTSFGGSFQPH
jgi:hypothetical protein